MGSCQSKEDVEGRLHAAEEDIKQEFELSKQALKDRIDQAGSPVDPSISPYTSKSTYIDFIQGKQGR